MRGASAERSSLLFQAARFRKGQKPAPEKLEEALEWTTAQYPRSVAPGWCSRELSDRDITEALMGVKAESSPGLPWLHFASTKGGVIESFGAQLYEAVHARIALIRSVTVAFSRSLSAMELVLGGFVDPIRVFVKNEFHTVEKCRTGRYRLICSLSIVDEVVERLLYSNQNKIEIASWLDIPSKPGIGFTDAMNREVWNRRKDVVLAGKAAWADISGWDWNVKQWMLEADSEIRSRLVWGVGADEFRALAAVQSSIMENNVFVLSSGEMFAQVEPGIMLSGRYVTSSTNSRMRILAARLVGAEWADAAGDDSLEDYVPGALESYDSMGLLVKYYEKCSDGRFSFCSHEYSEEACFLESWEKGLLNLLQGPYDEERHSQFLYEYRGSPQLRSCVELIQRSGWIRKDG